MKKVFTEKEIKNLYGEKINYTNFFNVEEGKKMIEQNIIDKYFTKLEKIQLEHFNTDIPTEEEKQEFVNKMRARKLRRFFIADRLSNKEFMNNLVVEDSKRKEYIKKRYNKTLKNGLSKAVEYVTVAKIDDYELKYKDENRLKVFYAIHVVDREVYNQCVEENGLDTSNVLTEDTLRYIGETDSFKSRVKNHTINIYKRADYDYNRSNNLYQGLKEELNITTDMNETYDETKIIIYDVIGYINVANEIKEHLVLEGKISPDLKDFEVTAEVYMKQYKTVRSLDYQIYENIFIHNATKEKGHKLLNKQFALNINDKIKNYELDKETIKRIYDDYVNNNTMFLVYSYSDEGKVFSTYETEKRPYEFFELFKVVNNLCIEFTEFNELIEELNNETLYNLNKVFDYIKYKQFIKNLYVQEIPKDEDVNEVYEKTLNFLKEHTKYTRKTKRKGSYKAIIVNKTTGEQLNPIESKSINKFMTAINAIAQYKFGSEYSSVTYGLKKFIIYNLQNIKKAEIVYDLGTSFIGDTEQEFELILSFN